MKKILVTGATGFIGSRVVRELAARGDEVTVLTRSLASAERLGRAVRARLWSPGRVGDWFDALDGQDAVVNLAGEQAVGVRWTEETKRRILESRVETTRRLVEAIGRAEHKPNVLVSASAVGYYGAVGAERVLDERAPAGEDFLARVCVAWEAAASQAQEHGLRVVIPRIGIVIGPGGGALAEMVRPFRLFAGGPIGSGEQVVSWVHLDDLVAIFLLLIDDVSYSGPVNVVAPSPLSNAELAREIGRVLRRPSWLKVPEVALRARFGEGADPLVTGQRVVPAVLGAHRYVWRQPEISGALEAALGAT